MSGVPSMRLAAVDIGTVTTRLLIADVAPPSITEVVRSTDITHLGEGLTETGRLDAEAMERVAGVIEGYAAETKARGVEQVTAIATSASRDAENGDELLALLEDRGIRPDIISGDHEAALSFAGATSGLEGEGLLVVDLGGGSTELVLGSSTSQGTAVTNARSLDVGSRRITEMFLSSDPPTPAEIDRARQYVTRILSGYFDSLSADPHTMVSVAGTATTLASIHLELAEYDASRVHGSTLDRAELTDLLGMLADMPLAERVDVNGLHPGRAPVIVAGALILGCVLEASGLDATVISDHDILYGILLDTHAGRVQAR
jgi:exopolyphosphatase/guanosine-5'-triphosphate,3'-diphosphate pyrophosphatase